MIWSHTYRDHYNCTYGLVTAQSPAYRSALRHRKPAKPLSPQKYIQEAIPDSTCTSHAEVHQRKAALPLLRSAGCQPRIDHAGRPFTRPLGRTHSKKGTVMSHYDRFTPQASVSPAGDISNTRVATFPTDRRVIRRSTASLRHAGKVHHRVCAMRTICSSDEQNRLLTGAIKRISGNSRVFDTGCRRQYRGRRRHGPVWQVFQMA